MENELFMMLQLYAQEFPGRLEQLTGKDLKDYIHAKGEEVKTNGDTDCCSAYYGNSGTRYI